MKYDRKADNPNLFSSLFLFKTLGDVLGKRTSIWFDNDEFENEDANE